jgi:hypothetical protein
LLQSCSNFCVMDFVNDTQRGKSSIEADIPPRPSAEIKQASLWCACVRIVIIFRTPCDNCRESSAKNLLQRIVVLLECCAHFADVILSLGSPSGAQICESSMFTDASSTYQPHNSHDRVSRIGNYVCDSKSGISNQSDHRSYASDGGCACCNRCDFANERNQEKEGRNDCDDEILLLLFPDLSAFLFRFLHRVHCLREEKDRH